MTDNLEELEWLLAKATRGPWVADKHEIRHPDGPEKWGIPGGPQERANCAAIVALRNAAPSLIATAREVEGLRAKLAEQAREALAADAQAMEREEGLRAEVARLYTIILENSPDTPIADNGMTVWDGLQNEARAALEGKGG